MTHLTYSDIENAEDYFVGYGLDSYEACEASNKKCETAQYRRNQISSTCITEKATVAAYTCRSHLVINDTRIADNYLGYARNKEDACYNALVECKNSKKSNLYLSSKCKIANQI